MTGLVGADVEYLSGGTAAIVRHLSADDAVIRCAAAKALGSLGDVEAAAALVKTLLDEDPDVRTDTMEALITCARLDDAAAILRSLEGDPVKEVKVFAIQALARLEDRAAIPLIRRLAKERAEDEVAWEDDAGMWDDWLDVQVAAIEALGRLQVSEAIDDLLEVRTDEMGQELDDVILPTLAQIEDGGIPALLGFLRDRDARLRERAVKAMARARPETLTPMRELLLSDKSPDVRKLVLPIVDPNSERASDLVRHDPDPGVRLAALQIFGQHRPTLLEAALRDHDEAVRAAALLGIVNGDHRPLPADLVDNVQAWTTVAGAPLATAAAAVLPEMLGDRATPPLCRLAETTDRPLDVRIAALNALAETAGEDLIETLINCVVDPTRQIRAAALGTLASLAGRTDHARQHDAANLLAAAIRGELGKGAKAHPPLTEQENDLGASKVEGGQGHLTITRGGDIVTADDTDNVTDGSFPKSTLDALRTIDIGGDERLDEPSVDGPKANRRRVPIDGPTDIAIDIRRVALTMAATMVADCPNEQVMEALITALSDDEPAVRAAAFRALAQRSDIVEVAMLDKIDDALDDPDAAIRHDAARILADASIDDIGARLSVLLEDEDAMVRSVAIGRLGRLDPMIALAALDDSSSLVRRAALDGLLDAGDAAALKDGIQLCLAKGHADTLVHGQKRCPDLREPLLARSGDEKLSRLETLTALKALSCS